MSKLKSHIVIFFLFLLCSSFGYGQFHADSLKIAENIKIVLSKQVDNEDSLSLLLSKGISKKTPETDDLVQYYLAYNYLIKRDFEKFENTIKRNLKEDEHVNVKEVKFLNLKASYLASQKDYLNAVRVFLKVAAAYNKFDDTLKEAIVYHNIANIHLALGDHAQAHQYSSRSFNTYRKYPDDPNYLSILGVLTICENNINLLDSSRIHIKKGLEYLTKTKHPTGEMLLYFAKAELEYLSKKYEEAEKFALESLIKSTNYNAYQFISMNSILLMNIYNKTKRYLDALTYGEKALKMSDAANNSSMHHEITNGLSIAYAGLSDYEMAYYYKNETDSLKSIDRNRKNKIVMDSLLVRYDALENENMILSQKADIAMKDVALGKQVNILISLCVIIILLLVFYRVHFSVLKHREERLLVEAIQESESKLRNRLYSELHDSLLAELTVLKYELERRDDSQKELAILKKSHDITRSIAHNLSTYLIFDKGLVKSVQDMVSNNASDIITFYTNIDEKLELKPKVTEILYRTIQELIQNAIKHSGGTRINVQLLLRGSNLKISVEDNGKGISNEEITNSTGIRSLFKRMEIINANLNFDYSTDAGTIAIITLKV